MNIVRKTVNSRFGLFCLFIATLGVGFLPPYIMSRDSEGKRKFGSGGGTAGSIVATLVAIWLLIWGSFESLLWILGVSATLAHLFVGTGEEYLRQLTERRTGNRWRMNHKGCKVFEDFNETCIDEFVAVLLMGVPIFLLDVSLWVKVFVSLLALVAFRILDGKQKVGLAKWADQNVKGTLGCMLDDYFVGMQVSAYIAFWLAFQHVTVNSAMTWEAVFFMVWFLVGAASLALPTLWEDFKALAEPPK